MPLSDSTSSSATSDVLPSGLRGYAQLIRQNPNMRNIWLGQVVSQLGDWFNTVALLGLLIDLTQNPASASWAIVAQILPSAITGLFISGVVADRFDRKKIMITADIARAIIALSYLLIGDASLVWIAYAATAGLSIGGAFFSPAASAALPNLVSKAELPVANALWQSTFASMLLIGAAIGGGVTHLFGRKVAFIMNSLSFLGSAFFIWRVQGRFSAVGGKQLLSGMGTLRVLTEGFRYLKENRFPRTYALVKPAFSWVFGAISLYPAYALTIYNIGDIGTSWLYVGRGLGAFISPLIVAALTSLTNLKSLTRSIRLGVFITIFGYTVFAFSREPIMGMIGTFFGHFGAALVWTFSKMILQSTTPDYVRGRVLALDDVMMSLVTSGGNIIVGTVASIYAPQTAALTAVGLSLMGALVWLVAARGVEPNEMEHRNML